MSGESHPSQQRFSSRLGLLLSVLGIAVGTGNIWRFPRIAAQNGGDEGAGAFLLVWAIFLFAWSLPLIIAEYALGRMGRMGVVGTFVRLGGQAMAPLGGFVGFVAAAIMFYYSVVSGWCFFYLGQSIASDLPTSTAAAKTTWDTFQAGPTPLLLHGLAMTLGTLAVRRGVASIERLNRILIPSLLVIVAISAVRAVTLPGASEGLAYLFRFQPSQLANPNIWLEALTQNAWDTGAGWGLILCYGAYMSRRDTVVKNAVITGVANNTVSLIAAATIFGTVFALLGAEMSRADVLGVLKDSGPASTGLTFIWMPQLFAKMSGGRPLAIIFFLGLSFAALSSLLSMIELSTRALVDMGITRARAATLVGVGGFALGVPSATNLDVLSNQDFVWGVALMISGLFIARLVTTRGTAAVRDQFRGVAGDWDPGPLWETWIRWVVPILAVALLVWWLFLSATAYAPETWWDPTDPFSVMTCLLQWGVVLAALTALRRRLADGLAFGPSEDAEDRD